MKKLVAICLCMASLHARGDVVVVERVQFQIKRTQGQTREVIIKIKGNKARTDMASEQSSSIVDTRTGDMTALNHKTKTAIKVPGVKMTEAIAHDEKAQVSAEKLKTVDTGRQEKIGKYNAEVFTVETTGGKTTIWSTREVPDYAYIQGRLAEMQLADIQMGLAKYPYRPKIGGLAVKSEVLMPNGNTITTTIISAKVEPVDESEFQVPAGYADMPESMTSINASVSAAPIIIPDAAPPAKRP